MYEKMFDYVKNVLALYNPQGGQGKSSIMYDRYLHIRRVYKFVHRIYEGLSQGEKVTLNLEALEIAAIFHDAGYGHDETTEHAAASESICRNYLQDMGYDLNNIDFICYLVANHSKKELLSQEDIPLELIILMEADLLDDTGSFGLVVDIWIESLSEDTSFESILEHIKKYTYRVMQKDIMRTEPGRRIWEEKKKLTNEFVKQYEMDLEN